MLAPGEYILADGTARALGTSYATALVSGVAALLLSVQLRRGQRPDPQAVRDAILAAAQDGLINRSRDDDARYLAGRLDVRKALFFLTRGRCTMSDTGEVQVSDLPANRLGEAERSTRLPAATEAAPSRSPRASRPAVAVAAAARAWFMPSASSGSTSAPRPASIRCAENGRGCRRALPRAVGRLRRPPLAGLPRAKPLGRRRHRVDPLAGRPTLYAIRPVGPFAADGYRLLQPPEGATRRRRRTHLDPGVAAGKATLLNGQTVPVIAPDLRGMYSWTTKRWSTR